LNSTGLDKRRICFILDQVSKQKQLINYQLIDKRRLKHRTQVGPLFAMRWKQYKIIGGFQKMDIIKGKQSDNEQPFMWYSFPEKSTLKELIQVGSSQDWKSADPWNENQQAENSEKL